MFCCASQGIITSAFAVNKWSLSVAGIVSYENKEENHNNKRVNQYILSGRVWGRRQHITERINREKKRKDK